MVWYKRPEKLRGIIFDMDNTLYSNEDYTRHQEDVLVARLAQERSENLGKTREALQGVRSSFAAKNNGKKPSLGNAFLELGIPIATSIAWRKQLIQPEHYLSIDHNLISAIHELSGTYKLAVVTNNPVEIAQRTFRVLGLDLLLPTIIGLDTFAVSKPDPRAFAHAARLMALAPELVLSIGDRYEIDIEPALGLGMGGLLVTSVSEIHGLPSILMEKTS